MTKVTMPEPVAWLHVCRKKPELRGLLYDKSAPELAARGFVPEPLITTAQAEAYADARVREALLEAYRSIQELHMSLMNDSTPYVHPAQIASFAANRISALIKRIA